MDGVLLTPSVAQYVKCVLGAPGVEEDVLLDSECLHRSSHTEEEDRMSQDTTRTRLKGRSEGQGAYAQDTMTEPVPSTSNNSQSTQSAKQRVTGKHRLFPYINDTTLETPDVPSQGGGGVIWDTAWWGLWLGVQKVWS